MEPMTPDDKRKALVSASKGDVRIVIGQRGWVWVGRYAKTAGEVTLTDAAVIRVWGTTMGIGELPHQRSHFPASHSMDAITANSCNRTTPLHLSSTVFPEIGPLTRQLGDLFVHLSQNIHGVLLLRGCGRGTARRGMLTADRPHSLDSLAGMPLDVGGTGSARLPCLAVPGTTRHGRA